MAPLLGECGCECETLCTCCDPEGGDPLTAAVIQGPVGVPPCPACAIGFSCETSSFNDVLKLRQFASSDTPFADPVTLPAIGTSIQGEIVTITSTSSVEIRTVGLSLLADMCDGTQPANPTWGKALLQTAVGIFEVDFDAAHRVCRAVFMIGAGAFGSFDVQVDAWDNKGNHVTSTATVNNSLFLSGGCTNPFATASAKNGGSLTKMTVQSLTDGVKLAIGDIGMCLPGKAILMGAVEISRSIMPECADTDWELSAREIASLGLDTRKRWFRCSLGDPPIGHGQHCVCGQRKESE